MASAPRGVGGGATRGTGIGNKWPFSVKKKAGAEVSGSFGGAAAGAGCRDPPLVIGSQGIGWQWGFADLGVGSDISHPGPVWSPIAAKFDLGVNPPTPVSKRCIEGLSAQHP